MLAIAYALTMSENPVCGALVSISPLDLAYRAQYNHRNKPGSLAELFKVAHSLTSLKPSAAVFRGQPTGATMYVVMATPDGDLATMMSPWFPS